ATKETKVTKTVIFDFRVSICDLRDGEFFKQKSTKRTKKKPYGVGRNLPRARSRRRQSQRTSDRMREFFQRVTKPDFKKREPIFYRMWIRVEGQKKCQPRTGSDGLGSSRITSECLGTL